MLHEYDSGDPFQPGGYVAQSPKGVMFNKNDLAREPVTPWDFQANPDDGKEPWEMEFINNGTTETAHCKAWTDYGWGWYIEFTEDHNLKGQFAFNSPQDSQQHFHVGDQPVKAIYIGSTPIKRAYVGNTPILG